MLYRCVECDREIAEDAGRCPSCGTGNAGHRAIVAHGARHYYSQPDWREREAEKAAREKASSDAAWRAFCTVWLLFITIGAVWAGVDYGVVGAVIGGILGAIVGFIPAGAVVLLFD